MSKNLRWMLAAAATSISIALVGCAAPIAQPSGGEGAKIEKQGDKPVMAKVAIDAKFAQWLPTPNGKIGGMLLEDGGVVLMHQESMPEVALAKGDSIHIDGLKFGETSTAYVHATVTKEGKTIVAAKEWKGGEKGEWKKHKKHADKDGEGGQKPGGGGKHHGKKHGEGKHGWMNDASLTAVSGTGTIVAILPGGHHGGIRGVVLSDGTVAYAPHHKGAELKLNKGDQVTVNGKGGNYPAGRALVLESITLPNGTVQTLGSNE